MINFKDLTELEINKQLKLHLKNSSVIAGSQFSDVSLLAIASWLTVVEVELRYGQQHPGERQIRAQPTKQGLYRRERTEDQGGLLNAHAVQDAHCLRHALEHRQRGSLLFEAGLEYFAL